MNEKTAKIYIAGHRGLAGSAIVRALQRRGYSNLLLRNHSELDLISQSAVRMFFDQEKPDYVFLAAGKVGGILANNTYPAEFIYQNQAIQTNIIHESQRVGVRRLLFLGSSCVYPRECPQPITEESLLSGALEATNRSYAIAKIAGIEMCGAYYRQYGSHYLAAMPANLYGVGDNYDPDSSHVLPALIRKVHQAKTHEEKHIVVWGNGIARREFLYSDDMASACIFLMMLPDKQFSSLLTSGTAPLVNIGSGEEVTIRELTGIVMQVVGFQGSLTFDLNKPEGTSRKFLDTSKLHSLGWKCEMNLVRGVKLAYEDYLSRFG